VVREVLLGGVHRIVHTVAVALETAAQPCHPETGYPARNDVAPYLFELSGGLVAAYSRAAPDGPEPNEDRAGWWSIGDRAVVLAIADGAGGHAAGGAAAELALGAMGDTLGAAGTNDDLRTCLLDAFELANRRVVNLKTGAAATLAAALIEGHTLRTFHAGDAQIVITGQRGKVRVQTIPHSPVGYAVEAGMLAQAEAIHHDERHLVSNVVGVADMHIEVGAPVRLQPLDTVVVASDGIFDNLEVPEVIDAVRAGPLGDGAARLAALCRQRMEAPLAGEPSKADDATFILFRPGKGTAR